MLAMFIIWVYVPVIAALWHLGHIPTVTAAILALLLLESLLLIVKRNTKRIAAERAEWLRQQTEAI